MSVANTKTKVAPSPASVQERPSSAASYNSWVRETPTEGAKREDNERTSTSVQFLSPNGGSVVSVREAAEKKAGEIAGPSSSGSRPATPKLDRPASPKPLRSASPSLSHKLKNNSVAPTDEELPAQEPKPLKKPDPVEAWSDDGLMEEPTKETPMRNRSPGEGAHSGSVPSMRSVISVREAAENHKIDGMSTSGRLTPAGLKEGKTSAGASRNADDSRSVVSRASGRIQPPQPAKQQQAYIPYVMARDTIAKVVDDMKTMKTNHVDIVQKIQDTHKKIENETQSQFNIFVLGLRTQYKEKVQTFKQVIFVHQQELERHKTYWESCLTSLGQKNKELMKQKKELLLLNKKDAESLQKEKEELMTELTRKMDEDGKSNWEKIKQLEESEKTLQDEKKILEDELASEKNTLKEKEGEIERLRNQLSEGGVVPLVVGADDGTVKDDDAAKERSLTSTSEAAVVAAGISLEERDRINRDREELQDKMIESQKELAVMQAKYSSLERQYRSVVSVAKRDEDSITAQMDDTKKGIGILSEEKSNLEDEIKKWEEDFKERTGQEPSEEDRPDSITELHIQLKEVETQETNMEAQLAALSELKEGRIPDPEEIPVPEPIIKTVEVTIPDPVTVAALTSSQTRNKEFQAEIKALKDQLNESQKSIRKLEKENRKLQDGSSKGTASAKDSANAALVLQAVIREMNTKEESSGGLDKTDLESQLKEMEGEKERLVKNQNDTKEKLESWIREFEEMNGRAPENSDRNDEIDQLYQDLQDANEKSVSLEAQMAAFTIMTTGQLPQDFENVSSAQVIVNTGGRSKGTDELEERLQEMEEEMEELKDRNSSLERSLEEMEEEKQSLKEKIDQLMSGGGAVEPQGEGSLQASGAMPIPSYDYYDEDDVEGLGAQLNQLRKQQDDLEKQLEAEKEAHEETKEELENLRRELEEAQDERATAAKDSDGKAKAANAAIVAEMALQTKSLEEAKQRIDELEKEKLKDIPTDSADEIRKLQEKLKKAEKVKDDCQKSEIQKTSELEKLKVDMETTQKALAKERETNRGHQENLKKKLAEKDKHSKEMVSNTEKKYAAREEENQKQIKTLEKKLKESKVTAVGGAAVAGRGGSKVDAKTEKKIAMMQDHINNLKKQVEQEKNSAKQLEKDLKEMKSGGAADKLAGKKVEKQLKDLEKKLESETKKFEREQKKATELDAQLKATTKERDGLADDKKQLQVQIDSLGVAAKEALELKEKVDGMKGELKELKAENKTLSDNYNSERVLRKKYYNMVEDMKGKIRVYCRSRPLSGSEKGRGNYEVIKAPDEYSIFVESNRGNKEFQFDHVFMPDSSQEDVFEDTNNLIQSAVDGYNVCIFAYGQTGSGKTFTMIGTPEFPGIAPRAFQKIFEVMEENKSKFSFKIFTYMCELYNDKLIDLYSKDHSDDARMDIKKDKKGMVFIQGAVIQEATNSKELFGLFEQGSQNRHVASTKMNSESSRSHLILAIIIESTNLATGSVVKGKLSLVDLAGSERAAKTGASAEQLREANSINKSLSALGDVISALSSEQQFIPYRNNKLTMLMQDSLGGNAKTLMFVNISPADYNAEETVISLTYASRVKLITNDASKNADNKEIARLKNIIAKLKKGEDVNEDDEEEEAA